MTLRSSALTIVFASVLLELFSPMVFGQDLPTEDEIGHVEVLLSEESALVQIFPAADSATPQLVAVDSVMRADMFSALGWNIRDSVFLCYEVFQTGQRIGTAVVADEQGKYRPITFMAGIDTDHRIVDVRVLVYRESRGGEVRHPRFLKQYRGKSLENPVRINRDIVNITGATISVNALNSGVRKALAVVQYLDRARNGTE